MCRTPSVLGCCWCTVQVREQISYCGSCTPNQERVMPRNTRPDCVNACVPCSINPGQEDAVKETAALPMSLGRLGLRSAQKLRVQAFWASWADCFLHDFGAASPVAYQLMAELEGTPTHADPQRSCGLCQESHWCEGVHTTFLASTRGRRTTKTTGTGRLRAREFALRLAT